MFGKSRLELKLGIFVFIGMVILTVFVLSIGDFKTWKLGYKIIFEFNFVNGVKIGAPVRFAGVDVGEVKNIDIILNPKEKTNTVKIFGWIKNEVKIPAGSTVWVNTLGLLGEKYIEIMPGENYSLFLKPNDTIKGNDPIAMHEVAELAKELVSDIDESITRLKNKEGTIGMLLYDDALYKEFETAVKGFKGLIKGLEGIIKGLEELTLDLKTHPWKLLYKPKEKKK